MDGVLYDADRLISGAAETVAWAKHHSIPYLFVTNTTSRDRAALVDKLRGFGIEGSEQEIMTPAVAVVQWLRQQGCNGPLALFLPPSVKASGRPPSTNAANVRIRLVLPPTNSLTYIHLASSTAAN